MDERQQWAAHFNSITAADGDLTVGNTVALPTAIWLTNGLMEDCKAGITNEADLAAFSLPPLPPTANWSLLAARAQTLANMCLQP